MPLEITLTVPLKCIETEGFVNGVNIRIETGK